MSTELLSLLKAFQSQLIQESHSDQAACLFTARILYEWLYEHSQVFQDGKILAEFDDHWQNFLWRILNTTCGDEKLIQDCLVRCLVLVGELTPEFTTDWGWFLVTFNEVCYVTDGVHLRAYNEGEFHDPDDEVYAVVNGEWWSPDWSDFIPAYQGYIGEIAGKPFITRQEGDNPGGNFVTPADLGFELIGEVIEGDYADWYWDGETWQQEYEDD